MAQSLGGSDVDAKLAAPRQQRGLVVALCLAVYLILAVAVFWPASPWNNSRLPSTPINVYGTNRYGYGDPAQMTWFLAWAPYALRHGLSIFHTGFLDYPAGVNLAANTTVPLLGLLASPVTVLLGPIAAFNILLRLAFAGSAASMFLVLRNWCRWPVAFVGGLAYGFGPYVVSQGQTHLNLAFVPLPPLMLWCLYELLFEQRRRPLRMGVLLGVLAGAQALISLEILALFAMVVAVGLVGLAVRSRADLKGRFGNLLRAVAPALLLLFLLDGWYFASLLFGPGHLVGTVAPVNSLQVNQTALLGPVVPTFNEALTLHSLSAASKGYVDGNFSENSSYIGLPILILLAYFAVRWRRDVLIAGSTYLALVALVLSFGPRLSLSGHETSIYLPEELLAHLPVYDNSVPARFSLIVWLFAIVAVTIGADRLIRSLWERRAHERITTIGRVATVLSLMLAVAFIVPRVPFITAAAKFPSDTEATLKVIPTGSVVLTYPSPTALDTEAMSWQAQDEMGFRLIGGYATVRAGDTGLPVTFFYATPPKYIDPRLALCHFIAIHHINAVIFWDHGTRPVEVKRLLLSDLGSPSRATRDKQLLVWLTTPGSCHP